MKDSSNASAPGDPPGVIRRLFFWSYDRGTLPYDIICGLILAFVFFMPRSCFAPKKTAANSGANPPAVTERATPPGNSQAR